MLFSFAANKSPGPNGFPPLFYKSFWKTTSKVLTETVQHFFKSGFRLKALNHTFIALIPKTSHSSKVEQFRPISLCNVVYKVISKILANRFKVHLDKFISPFQMAFVEGRSIHDNNIISHEIMNYLHKKTGNKCFMAIKVDLAKAFDRVEWDLLLNILANLGFCKKFIDWISQCLSTTSFSFLINGVPYGLINPTRGIRQGDPLSHFLIVVYTEVLSRLLAQTELFKGIKVSKTAPSFYDPLYADDLILFCRATLQDATCSKNTLDTFTNWSSQLPNPSKSSIHFRKNADAHTKNIILNCLGFKECSHKETHIGLHFCIPSSKTIVFQPLITKISTKLAGWKSKTLSQASKSVLITAVANAIPSYHMSVFLLPKSISMKMDASFRKFWWGVNKNGNSFMPKCWDSICLPKASCGLGFRKMHNVNRFLISKHAWNLATAKNSLPIKLFYSKYLSNLPFLTYDLSPANFSWIWKDILNTKDLIHKGACFEISFDSNVRIWDGPWIPILDNLKPSHLHHISLPYPSHYLVKSLMTDNSWNISLLFEAVSTPCGS